MDPISLTIGAIGLGMQIFGSMSAADHASENAKALNANAQQIAGISTDMTAQEQNINKVKQRQMEMEGRRTQMENIRNNQRARAMAENSATNQGANFGSGLQGGLAQINDQSMFNMSGVNSALSNGRDIAGFNSAISADKIQMAQANAGRETIQNNAQSTAASDQAFVSLGGAMMKAGPVIGQVSKGFGGGASLGNYSGTPGASNTGGLY